MKPLAASITPLVQRAAEEEEELQMKPLTARVAVEEEDELQMKPLVQRAPEEEEEEIQMKSVYSALPPGLALKWAASLNSNCPRVEAVAVPSC